MKDALQMGDAGSTHTSTIEQPWPGTMMEQRKRKVPVFLRRAIRQGIGVCIAVTLGYSIVERLGGASASLAYVALLRMQHTRRHVAFQGVPAQTGAGDRHANIRLVLLAGRRGTAGLQWLQVSSMELLTRSLHPFP